MNDYAWELKAQLTGPAPGYQKAFIVIERHCMPPAPDWDNLVGGIKPLLDAMVSSTPRNPSGIGVIHDDGPLHLPIQPIVVPIPVKKKSMQRTVVNVFELIEAAGDERESL